MAGRILLREFPPRAPLHMAPEEHNQALAAGSCLREIPGRDLEFLPKFHQTFVDASGIVMEAFRTFTEGSVSFTTDFGKFPEDGFRLFRKPCKSMAKEPPPPGAQEETAPMSNPTFSKTQHLCRSAE